VTYKQKLAVSAILGVLFALFASPMMFSQTKALGTVSPLGRTTAKGVLIHSIVFGLIVYLAMAPWKKSSVVCVTDGAKASSY